MFSLGDYLIVVLYYDTRFYCFGFPTNKTDKDKILSGQIKPLLNSITFTQKAVYNLKFKTGKASFIGKRKMLMHLGMLEIID